MLSLSISTSVKICTVISSQFGSAKSYEILQEQAPTVGVFKLAGQDPQHPAGPAAKSLASNPAQDAHPSYSFFSMT